MRIIHIIAMLLVFSACKQDDYHKNEFRCSVNGVRFSAPDYHRAILSGEPSSAFIDSAFTLHVRGWGKSDQGSECSLELNIKSFNGPGVYPVQRMKARLSVYANGQELVNLGPDMYELDSTADASVHITSYTGANKVAGYYHFLARDPRTNKRVGVSNGRFLLDVSTFLR